MGRANRSRVGGAVLAMTVCATSAHAGTITAVGSVEALTNVSQFGIPVGAADFSFAGGTDNIPLDAYSTAGMTFHTGPLSSILAGVTTAGTAFQPMYSDEASFPGLFPSPHGGGAADFDFEIVGAVVTFSVPVTQFGLTFSKNGVQFITAWSATGAMIGQVLFAPLLDDSGFAGIDTLGVPIAMLAIGNDDLFAGASYDPAGLTTITDSWKWAIPEPSTMSLLALGLGAAWMRRRFR
jgi:hypothetical protein